MIFFPLHTDFPLGSNLASSCSSDLTSITGCFGDFPGLFEEVDDDADFALATSGDFSKSCLISSFLASILGEGSVGGGPASAVSLSFAGVSHYGKNRIFDELNLVFQSTKFPNKF